MAPWYAAMQVSVNGTYQACCMPSRLFSSITTPPCRASSNVSCSLLSGASRTHARTPIRPISGPYFARMHPFTGSFRAAPRVSAKAAHGLWVHDQSCENEHSFPLGPLADLYRPDIVHY